MGDVSRVVSSGTYMVPIDIEKDSKKLGKFLGKWTRETETDS